MRSCYSRNFKIILPGLALCLSLALNAEEINGRVVGVADGDTLTILTNENEQVKIRLASIDAPEKKQDFGRVSKKSLSTMCFGVNAKVLIQDTDRYGRKVGVVYCNGIEANLEQVERGLAWVYIKYAKDQKYDDAENRAKDKKLGIWSIKDLMPAWEFRKNNKSKGL